MKLKMRKIIRPEITIEYKGIKGLCIAIVSVIKVGIKRVRCNIQIKGNEHWGVVKVITVYAIPKYEFKRVEAIPPPSKLI